MFEDMTFDAILADGKKQVRDDIIKTEGSLVHNALAAMAYELEKLYIQADYIAKQSDPKEADYENLVKLAAARAVYPDEATYAQVRMEADTDVPMGARFSLSAYNYIVTEELSDKQYNYTMKCEEAGSGPNGLKGDLIAISYVDGLTKATITELLVAGKNASTKEELYQKYMNSFKESAFAGNIAAYKEYLISFDGIGGAKIYPVWNGPGTVKGVLIGADYNTVSDYLIQEIQDKMNPEEGEGYGTVPIGHTTTIMSVEAITVDITTQITFKTGYSWAMLQEQIEKAMGDYLSDIRQGWKDGGPEDYETVYISRIEAAVLNVIGVVDITGTQLNGTAANLILTTDQIPVLGVVSGV